MTFSTETNLKILHKQIKVLPIAYHILPVPVSRFRSYKSLKIGFHSQSADRPLNLAS